MNIQVELINHGNDDLTVVNAARVSFNKLSEYYSGTTISRKDQKLIKYLADHKHFTPFCHSRFTFIAPDKIMNSVPFEEEYRTGLVFTPLFSKVRHSFFGWIQLLQAGYINPEYSESLKRFLMEQMPVSSQCFCLELTGIENKSVKHMNDNNENDPRFIDFTLREEVPIFVARQRFKHKVGFIENEISRRYVSDEPEFYYPDSWRGAPVNGAKQGSSGNLNDIEQKQLDRQLTAHHQICLDRYNEMLKDGVAPEQARMVLPQSMMTSYWVTGSKENFKRAYDLRIDNHAQKEIQDLAKQWGNVIGGLTNRIHCANVYS